MKRKILLQLVLPLLGLIALFSMLAFAPNSAQRHPALLEMSVILREADSSILSTTRQGMEQAAADLNVELRTTARRSRSNSFSARWKPAPLQSC